MAETFKRQKTVVIGGGPVGALAALYAAQRGHEVELYELRSDLRDPSTTPLNFTKSINLALSERGINAMRHAERPDLLEKVLSASTPMSGRMIHLKDKSGNFIEQSQEYDVHGRSLYAIDRGGLNGALLNELETLPNVKLFFNHKMTGADFRDHKAWFEIINPATKRIPGSRHREIEISFDFLIGADGAHSAARYHLMKYTRMDYLQEYINMLWCEFTIPAKIGNSDDPDSRFRISPHHLHIWPGHELMFIAIPSIDGSFTCTLFQPAAQFAALEKDPQIVPGFFDSHFPGVTSLIDPSDLVSHFTSNPHLPLISIKCHPYHYTDAAVIVGDAAHAMVPFYGQGMNAGLEDIRVLFSILDSHITASPSASPAIIASQRAAALAAYSSTRKEDAHAINDLALQNYTEMSSSVVSRSYKLRKWLEEALSVYVPSLGWQTKYSRVSFENEPYAEVIRRSERQGRLLGYWLVGLVSSPVMIGGLAMWWRWGNRLGIIRGR